MACTEAQKRAMKKYFDKLKGQGIKRDHGTNEQARFRQYKFNTIKFIARLFQEN
jgi:hypothetical protein